MKPFEIKIDPKYLHSEITSTILQGFYTICNVIGYGFEIEFFKKALIIEFENLGLKCETEKQINVNYLNIEIGNFKMDILVDEKVNVMLVSSEKITREHETKMINQLKLSEIEVGLLLNIHVECEHRRKIYTNDLKLKNQPQRRT